MGKYPNSGILSRNQNRKSDKHPEYTGSAEVEGVEYWLGAWVKKNDKGSFFSISFTPKQPQGDSGRAAPSRPAPQQHEEDPDVPF